MVKLQASGLTRVVEGRTLFGGLSFGVEAGETLVIRGPSGVGKSVLLRALAWLDPLQGGEVRLDGKTPPEWSAPVWRSQVSFVAQAPATFPGTPRDLARAVLQLATQRGRDGEDPIAIAARWELPADVWDRRWLKLSGGERQRVSLALALSRSPTVLLLDEPTAAVDPEATEAIEAELRGCTAVWVTHDDAQAERVGGRFLELSA